MPAHSPWAAKRWRCGAFCAAFPNYGQDIRDRDLPQETEQMQALTFTKGCYIGQEIVERIRARGQVHRKFTGFVFGEHVPPSESLNLKDAHWLKSQRSPACHG